MDIHLLSCSDFNTTLYLYEKKMGSIYDINQRDTISWNFMWIFHIINPTLCRKSARTFFATKIPQQSILKKPLYYDTMAKQNLGVHGP